MAYRPWMVDGMTITGNGDAMYMGLRRIQNDVTESVINWGDNANPDAFGADNLVFRFTRAYQSGANDDTDVSSLAGLQLMRMTATDGGKVGVGNLWDSSTNGQPQRKLHVDDAADTALDAQLRISYDPLSTFADFWVSNSGELSILTENNSLEQNVGINVLNPTEMVDVNGNGRFRSIPQGAGDVLITGVEQSAQGDYALSYLEFNNNDQTYLAGDGTWQPLLNNAACVLVFFDLV
jgi:hypothetical protein